MSADELKKVNITYWEEKIHPYLGINYIYNLQEVESYLKEMEYILSEGNMSGLDYRSQEDKIEDIGTGIGYLNSYISSLVWELDEKIDHPLYQGFQNEATEFLSRISMEEYTTDNTLQIRRHHEMLDENGSPISFDSVAPSLSMKDFLGLTGLDGEDVDANLVGIPKEFRDFTNLFAADYDKIKESLKDENGRQITLEEYLTTLNTYGEFSNQMDKPVLEFISSVLDVTIIKPVIEMCTGYDLITKEDLSDLERGMKGVFAAVDAVTLMIGIKASDGVKFFSKEALKLAGKTMAVDMLANGAAYGVGKAGEELGLPLPVTLLLSLGAGMTVSISAGKYVFKDSAGNVLLEAGEQEVDTVKGTRGVKTSGSSFGDMNPADTARYNQYWDDVAKGLDQNTRIKLNQWDYRPNADLYNKYKSVYDNPLYFNQLTGNVNYPGMNGDKNIDGFINGQRISTTLESGTVIDRYGSNGSGKYFSPKGTSYEQRALPPFMEEQPYTKYKVLRPLEVEAGKIAPWFEQPGQGIQFLSKYSVDDLKKLGYIVEIK